MTMTNEIQCSIVIPIHNSAESLNELIDRIVNVMETVGNTFEVILIDDGSSDNSWNKMKAIRETDNRIKIIQLFRNFGQHNATMCGFAHSKGKHIISIDSDLEHHPEDIPKLLKYREHDIVIAQLIDKTHNFFKKVTSSIKDWFICKLINAPKGIQISSFRMLKRDVVKNMLKISSPYPYIPALMFFVSRDVKGVPINHGVRKYGKSSYSLKKMVSLFSNLMINNSSYLLQLVGKFGFFSALIGFLLSVYFITNKLFIHSVIPGWTSLIVLSLIFSGLILITLGIIGEYLKRIISNVDNRPSYIERIVNK